MERQHDHLRDDLPAHVLQSISQRLDCIDFSLSAIHKCLRKIEANQGNTSAAEIDAVLKPRVERLEGVGGAPATSPKP